MCQFCKEHGEGKKWYLQTKNYAMDMLHEELTPEYRAIVKASTRSDWVGSSKWTKTNDLNLTSFSHLSQIVIKCLPRYIHGLAYFPN